MDQSCAAALSSVGESKSPFQLRRPLEVHVAVFRAVDHHPGQRGKGQLVAAGSVSFDASASSTVPSSQVLNNGLVDKLCAGSAVAVSVSVSAKVSAGPCLTHASLCAHRLHESIACQADDQAGRRDSGGDAGAAGTGELQASLQLAVVERTRTGAPASGAAPPETHHGHSPRSATISPRSIGSRRGVAAVDTGTAVGVIRLLARCAMNLPLMGPDDDLPDARVQADIVCEGGEAPTATPSSTPVVPESRNPRWDAFLELEVGERARVLASHVWLTSVQTGALGGQFTERSMPHARKQAILPSGTAVG